MVIGDAYHGQASGVFTGDFEEEMPFVDELIDEDGKLQLFYDKEDHSINICIYNQRFCKIYDVDAGDKATIKKMQELITIMDILTSQGCVIKDKIAGYDCDLYTCGLWLFSTKTEQTMYGSFEICVPKNGENPYVFTVTDTDGFKLWNNAKLILEKN